jgi:hypothetical protein
MEERALARNKEAEVKKLKKSNEQEVRTLNVDEWDCPKPGTAHQRQLIKQRNKLTKQKDEQTRKRLEKQEIDPSFINGGKE